MKKKGFTLIECLVSLVILMSVMLFLQPFLTSLIKVEEKIKSINEVKSCEVEITFDPPWSKDLMSEEAKLELGML